MKRKYFFATYRNSLYVPSRPILLSAERTHTVWPSGFLYFIYLVWLFWSTIICSFFFAAFHSTRVHRRLLIISCLRHFHTGRPNALCIVFGACTTHSCALCVQHAAFLLVCPFKLSMFKLDKSHHLHPVHVCRFPINCFRSLCSVRVDLSFCSSIKFFLADLFWLGSQTFLPPFSWFTISQFAQTYSFCFGHYVV